MITVTVRRKCGRAAGFRCLGHSGYAESGKDIVCAAVSALVINTVNAIGKFTASDFDLDTEEETGRIDFSLKAEPDHDAELLLDAMLLGLQDIQNNYGNEYLILEYEEV